MRALAGRTSLGTTASAEIDAAGGRRAFLDSKHPSCRIWAEAAAGASSKRPLTWEGEARSPRPFTAVAPVRIRYGVLHDFPRTCSDADRLLGAVGVLTSLVATRRRNFESEAADGWLRSRPMQP